jgi:hypothetical protein
MTPELGGAPCRMDRAWRGGTPGPADLFGNNAIRPLLTRLASLASADLRAAWAHSGLLGAMTGATIYKKLQMGLG